MDKVEFHKMKTPLAELNELAQKQFIDQPQINFEVLGLDHQKKFKCQIEVNGFNAVIQVASSKDTAKRKAAEILLNQIKDTIDLTKKPKLKGVSSLSTEKVAPQALNSDLNAISQLLEYYQNGLIDEVDYQFKEYDLKPQRQYECIAKVAQLEVTEISTSKKKSKLKAASTLIEALKDTNLLSNKSELKPLKKSLTPLAKLHEYSSRDAIGQVAFELSKVGDHEFNCQCKVDQFVVNAQSSSKKDAKQLASKLMIEQLELSGIDLSKPVKESKYAVEPNATRDWIYSICPIDVEIRKVSWYLESNCVLLTLGVKRKNPSSSVEKLKKQIEDETKLFVLINRERDAKKAIERLKSVANKDGIITDAKQLEPIALGSYFKPKAYDEPIINWDNRVDHTKDHCFTIDSDSSIDLDDAFSFEVKDNGLFICIHIADVSELVIENSKEDYKAKRQCFSYYGASKQLPMLLNQTMYKASLLPHKDRMAWTVAMQLDHDANLKHYRIYPSVIRSKFRLDQATIAKLIDKKADKQSKAFELMTELSDKLMQKRLQSGGVTEIAEENIGYQLVQEYMLLANQVVADYCCQKNIPIPYRTHQFADDSIDIKALYNQEKNHKGLMSFLGRASYNVEPKIHEALAFKTYCHFTSPIRRYADLLVQRQLRRFVFGEPIEDSQTMQNTIKILNQCEQELEISQTTIRYIERLEVQFRQCGKPVEAIIEKEEDGFYFLKALSSKHDRYLMIGTHEIKDKLTIGNSLKVIQESYYDVINEGFGCFCI